MRASSHILQFLLAALLVMMLGGLAGWYLFVRERIETTDAVDAARGFGVETESGSPLGSTYQNVISTLTGGQSADTGAETREAPRLWRVTAAPAAGAGFLGSTARLEFVERATGNLFLADPATSEIDRLTNTLVRNVREALIAPDGFVVLRALADDGSVTTFAGSATTSAATTTDPDLDVGRLDGAYLPHGIVSIALSPDGGERLLYIVASPEGDAVAVTALRDGSEQTKEAELSIAQWSVQWPEDSVLVLVQNPSDSATGHAYRIGANEMLEPLVRAETGLQVRAGPEGAVLYSAATGGSLALFVRASEDADIVRLPVRTTADKCVWAPDGSIAYCAVPQTTPPAGIIDARHQGAAHTSDAWWRIDAGSGTATQVYAPASNLALDVERPVIDALGTHIAFLNAADGSLWMLRIQE